MAQNLRKTRPLPSFPAGGLIPVFHFATIDLRPNTKDGTMDMDIFPDLMKEMKLAQSDFQEEKPRRELKTHSSPNLPNSLKSLSYEALVAQNDDLASRLKVILHRMHQVEQANHDLSEQFSQLRSDHSAIQDQMLVWKEKELLWKHKNEILSAELARFHQRFPELEAQEEKIRRFERYQDKVKTQIKPYIQELKAYAQSLGDQLALVQRDLDQRDQTIAQLNDRLQSERDQAYLEIERLSQTQVKLISEFEEERQFLKAEVISLKESLQIAEEKAERLDRALLRQDELENMVIAYQRNKEVFEQELRSELNVTRNEASLQQKQNFENNLRIKDLEAQSQEKIQALEEKKNQVTQLEEQLQSLRHLWLQKNEENEKMTLQLRTLEKLNFELSKQLSESRRTAAQL
jgi:DNA repair exonuclease SbcCD ATPase subunit